MIAKLRGPLSVKNHSFAVYACSLSGNTIGSRVKPDAPYFPPLLEQPGFLLAPFTRPTQKQGSTNFALTAFYEVHDQDLRKQVGAAPFLALT
jgi:hypothetical protein